MANIKVHFLGVPEAILEYSKAAKRYRSSAHVKKLIRPAANEFRASLRRTVKAGPWKRSTGNLESSIRTFSFRGSYGLHVGAKIGGAGKGRYGDGFYFGFLDEGTSITGFGKGISPRRLMERTHSAAGQKVSNMMAMALQNDLKYLT